MNIIKFFFLTAIISLSSLNSSFAESTSAYKCSGSGMRGPFHLTKVGLGGVNGGNSGRDIFFCKGNNVANDCYMHSFRVDTSVGRNAYSLLLTAFALDKPIAFYCNGKWIDNIAIVND